MKTNRFVFIVLMGLFLLLIVALFLFATLRELLSRPAGQPVQEHKAASRSKGKGLVARLP